MCFKNQANFIFFERGHTFFPIRSVCVLFDMLLNTSSRLDLCYLLTAGMRRGLRMQSSREPLAEEEGGCAPCTTFTCIGVEINHILFMIHVKYV